MKQRFRITVEEVASVSESGYVSWEQAYQQIVPNIDISALVTVVNKAYSYDKSPTLIMKCTCITPGKDDGDETCPIHHNCVDGSCTHKEA